MFVNDHKFNLSFVNKLKTLFNSNSHSSDANQKRYQSKLISGEYNDLHDLNIAYVLKGFPTLSQTFVLNELRYLVENNFNVVVFCYKDPMDPVELDFDLEFIRFDSSPDLMSNLEDLLIEYQIDLIHTHFVYPPCTEFTYPICESLKIPFTVFAHAVDIFKYEIEKINNLEEITNSKYCKAIFTLSEYHRNHLISRGVPEEKIVITRQATDYEINELEFKDKEIKNIISISRFVEKKGIDVLIDAAKILEDEDFEFSIYGFGNLEKEYRKQIEELGLSNVSIKGLLNGPKEVKKAFGQSDILASPCRIAKDGDRDGIPTVIFEAMAYGVFVLTTDVSAIPEVIDDGKNGFIVSENNPEEFALKIKEIANMTSEERFEIAKQAQEDVQRLSSVENTMSTVLNTWSSI